MTIQEQYEDVICKAVVNFRTNGGQIYDAVKLAMTEHFSQIEPNDWGLVERTCNRACLRFM